MIFFGFNLTFFPQFILGYEGMPRRYASYAPEFQTLNVLSSFGAVALAIAYVMPLGYLRGRWCAANARRPIRGRPPDLNGGRRRRRRPRISR